MIYHEYKIPSEPAYVIMNTAMSPTWGFPEGETGCPDHCSCKCYDCLDLSGKCSCGFATGFCSSLPAHFLIDYVRIYQVLPLFLLHIIYLYYLFIMKQEREIHEHHISYIYILSLSLSLFQIYIQTVSLIYTHHIHSFLPFFFVSFPPCYIPFYPLPLPP